MDDAQVKSRINVILIEELESLERRIKDNILSNGADASGKTANSLRVSVKDGVGVLYGRQAFGGMETGRKAGKVPQSFYRIIKEWALSKGLGLQFDKEYKLNSFAYCVARKIAAKGTLLHRQGGRNTIYSKEIPQTITDIQTKVLAHLTQNIDIPKIIAINK